MGTYHTHTTLLERCLIHYTMCAFDVIILALTTLLYGVKYFIGMIKVFRTEFYFRLLYTRS
jgi:hypothetical protein